MKTVGILGGGQLGWMLSESIFKYGGKPLVLANESSLAADRIPSTTVGSWSDPEILESFFGRCDVVTIEVEHVDVAALEPHANKMVPSLNVVRLAQHRMLEKRFLAANGLPHAQFRELTTVTEARDVADELEYPLIAKTALGGYDGRGQYRVANRAEYLAAVENLGTAIDDYGVVLEDPLPLVAEASVIVARGEDGSIEFPVFDNDHRHHILDTTCVPSTLPAELQQAMRTIARQAADAMDLHGMLTTEFLISKGTSRSGGVQVGDLSVFVNEFAPRPHNSGHVSRNACTLSQFDALARVLLDLPLEAPELLSGHWCMANLLSDLWLREGGFDLNRALGGGPGLIDVVLYGKRPARLRRKMGHVVAHARSRSEAASRADRFRDGD